MNLHDAFKVLEDPLTWLFHSHPISNMEVVWSALITEFMPRMSRAMPGEFRKKFDISYNLPNMLGSGSTTFYSLKCLSKKNSCQQYIRKGNNRIINIWLGKWRLKKSLCRKLRKKNENFLNFYFTRKIAELGQNVARALVKGWEKISINSDPIEVVRRWETLTKSKKRLNVYRIT